MVVVVAPARMVKDPLLKKFSVVDTIKVGEYEFRILSDKKVDVKRDTKEIIEKFVSYIIKRAEKPRRLEKELAALFEYDMPVAIPYKDKTIIKYESRLYMVNKPLKEILTEFGFGVIWPVLEGTGVIFHPKNIEKIVKKYGGLVLDKEEKGYKLEIRLPYKIKEKKGTITKTYGEEAKISYRFNTPARVDFKFKKVVDNYERIVKAIEGYSRAYDTKKEREKELMKRRIEDLLFRIIFEE